MSLFPIFLKLTARPCLVIGAGNLAESKIESLRAAEAAVTVIAPPRPHRQSRPRSPSRRRSDLAPTPATPPKAMSRSDTFLVVTATNVPDR